MARYVEIKIIYEGVNITQDLEPYLINFTYNDNSGDKADDISLTLQDRDSQWLKEWFPSKGDKIKASIIVHDWFNENEVKELPCGEYEVDEISYKSPPSVLEIKATSSKVKGKAIREKHNKSWKNTELKTIASDIASDNGLELFYDCNESFQIERREQIESSDLEFLRKLCANYDLSVKVNDNKLIVFNESEYQEKSSVLTINADTDYIINYSFSSKSSQVYSKAHVRYHHAVKDELFDVEEEDDSVEGSERVLEINERVENESEARNLAKKKLSETNSREITGNITLMGNVNLLSGVNITLQGFGMFDGKYMLESVSHKVTQGYNTTLNIKMGSSEKKAAKTRKGKKQTKRKGNVRGSVKPSQPVSTEGMSFYE